MLNVCEILEPSSLSLAFGKLLGGLAGDQSDESLVLAGLLLGAAVDRGDSCLVLAEWAGRRYRTSGGSSLAAPDSGKWEDILLASGVVGEAGGFFPLVLEDGRLYLHRYWQYEDEVARFILAGTRRESSSGELEISEIPGTAWGDGWQGVACLAALSRKFLVITGGPGTGKTTTVVRIIAQVIRYGRLSGDEIALVAPTGKAAVRLQESIAWSVDGLDCPAKIREQIPRQVRTVHRLLGPCHGSIFFRYNEGNPLPFQLVVVDEASMVDLPLMAKLVRAIPEGGRLFLLGDGGQLSSVEPGSVLADICPPAGITRFSDDFAGRLGAWFPGLEPPLLGGGSPLHDCFVDLPKGHRFGKESGIGRCAAAVLRGDLEAVFEIMHDPGLPEVSWLEFDGSLELQEALAGRIDRIAAFLAVGGEAVRIIEALGKYRLLAAVRGGAAGVDAVNALVAGLLRDRGLIVADGPFYAGRPLMVTRNDYELDLYNGDVGVVCENPERGRREIAFQAAGGGVRWLDPVRLPPHEDVFAMTVHKSQGSEFDEVIIILPGYETPLVDRKLLYTALTRARSKVEVWAGRDALGRAVSNQSRRQSGLRAKVWGAAETAG